MTGLIVGTNYNAYTTVSGDPAMVMEGLTPTAINYAKCVNPVATNTVKTAQIHSWWHEEIAMMIPTQRNSDLPYTYIVVVNESSQQLFSTLTVCHRLWL